VRKDLAEEEGAHIRLLRGEAAGSSDECEQMGWNGVYECSTTSSQKRRVQSQSPVALVEGPFGDGMSIMDKSRHRDSQFMRDSSRSSVEGAVRSGDAAPASHLLGEIFLG
jgi:hypothetical protein